MAYLLETDTSRINEDILRRKEYYQYDLPEDWHDHVDENIIPRFLISKMISDNNYLQFHSYQLFVSNYINPNTPYSRLLMKWQTGTGKSIGALSIALNFIKYFQRESSQGVSTIGSVFIIGFTSHIFRNELLRFPEFGIISRDELNKLATLKKMAYNGTKFDRENLQEFIIKIKKRFNNRVNNGFFQFIGYKKLVNMIFILVDPNINISNLDENGIQKAIDDKKIKLNIPLLEEFKNSLIICDEIHNVYNSLDKNNWGVALQYVLNYHPSVRAVFMSATPISNNPSEVIDLLNLLLPHTHYPKKLNKVDFFDTDKKLKHGALDKIANLCKGRVSYLRDANPKYFPTKKFIGENLPGVSYLKFIRCPMSEFHYNTYKSVYTGSLTPESQYLTDFAIPNPNDPKIGMYQTSEIKKMLPYASQKWKDENKINFKNEKIVGDILRLQHLPKITNKFAKMMETINSIITNSCGKIFIYHNVIHMSGVLFIQEILLQNFIISECGGSTSNTLCAVCGKMRKDHNTTQLGGAGEMESHSTVVSLQSIENTAVKYNFTMNVYEIYIDVSRDMCDNTPLLEYKVCDNIVIIQCRFINEKLDNSIVIKILNQLSNTHKVLIQTNNDKSRESFTRKINASGFKIITNTQQNSKHDFGGCLYYGNSSLSALKPRAMSNLIARVEKFLLSNTKLRRKNIYTGGRPKNKNKSKNQNKKYTETGVKLTQSKASDHTYMPVRFISVHSDLDRSSMNNSLDKYNSPDNSDGYRIMILVGGKLIKEAYDIKAVRELMVMGRPDNIPTLIQIMGRVVRKNSHKYLPPGKKNVNIRIFTSSMPTKKNGVYELGYEEDKYAEKIQHYKVIQNIEKTLHENAVDAFINRDIIWSKKEQREYQTHKKKPELGSLYFEPNLPKNIVNKSFKLNELNLQTFNAFHSNNEIDNIVIIIKRLFLERSPVWTYNDLLYSVRNARKWMDVEFNTQLINEDLFIVALSRLVWAKDANYTEPIVYNKSSDDRTNQTAVNNIISKIFDSDDKIIILPGNQKSVITQVGLYYIMFPLDELNNEPIKVAELPYRINKSKESTDIHIKSFLESGHSLIQYTDKRDRFFNKWNNVLIEKLELAVCDFGTDFHIAFLEECIEYIFNVWIDPEIKKSLMHAFYFKMINYYDMRKLVVWGHTIKQHMFKKYDKYLNHVTIKLNPNTIQKLDDFNIKEKDMSTSGLINLLKSSINKSELNWVSSGLKKQFETNLSNSLKLFDGNYKKQSNRNSKVDSNFVPVGHFLNNIPKFYHPNDGWIESPEYLNNIETFIENSIIVGYDERSKTGVHIRFKIRNPIQNIKQFKDSRLIEKGSVCSSKSKVYLKEIAEKLGIKLNGKINVTNLCNDIRTKLIYFELKERVAKSKKKFFYFIYERRPETITDEIIT
jgi:hypothetical protein